MTGFDAALVLQGRYHDWLVSGFITSLQLAALALLLALPLGLAVALLRLAPQAVLRAAGGAYVEAVRNVPLVAHLLFWYFGVPALLPAAWKPLLEAGNVEFLSGVAALTVYASAYMAEDIRSGVRSVPAAQWQAALALGLGRAGVLRWVVLPQALRVALPPLLLQMLNLWKDSSVATVIGVAELMYQAARVESASFRSAEAFAFATVAYGSVSLAIGGSVALVQRRQAARGAGRV